MKISLLILTLSLTIANNDNINCNRFSTCHSNTHFRHLLCIWNALSHLNLVLNIIMKVDIYSYFIEHRGSEKLSSLSEVIKPLDGKKCQLQTQSCLISSSVLSLSTYPGTLQFWNINRVGRFCMEWYLCLKININMPAWNPPPLAWSFFFFFPMKNLNKQYFRLWRSRILFLSASSKSVPIKWNWKKDVKSAREVQQQCVQPLHSCW